MEKKKKKNSTVYVHTATTITVIHLLFVCESSTSVATQLVGGHTRLTTLTRHLLSIGHAIRLFDGWDGQKKKKKKELQTSHTNVIVDTSESFTRKTHRRHHCVSVVIVPRFLNPLRVRHETFRTLSDNRVSVDHFIANVVTPVTVTVIGLALIL